MLRLPICCLYLIAALLGGATPLCAQHNLRFHHLSFPQPFVSGLMRDKAGFAWISTKENLYRYDGKTLTPFGLSAGLKSRDIQSQVWQDEQEDLWFCTTEALYCLTKGVGQAQRYPLLNERSVEVSEGYHLFYLDTLQGCILLTVQQKLYAFHYRRAKSAPNSGETSLYTLLLDRDYTQLSPIVHEDGSVIYCDYSQAIPAFFRCLVEITGTRWLPVARTCSLPAARYYHLIQGSGADLWAATSEGLLYFRPTDGYHQFFPTKAALRHLAYWSEGNAIWAAGIGAGLWQFDIANKAWKPPYNHHNNNPYSISDNDLQGVWVDAESNLWVAAWTRGLDHTNLKKLKFQTLALASENGASFVPEQLSEDAAGNLWISSRKSGLLLLDKNGRLRAPLKAATHVIQTFAASPNTTLISTFGPLLQYSNTSGTATPVFEKGTQKPVSAAFMVAHQGRILAGKPFDQGCWVLEQNGKTWTAATALVPRLNEGLWGMMYKDQNGRVWADQWGRGLQLFQDGTCTAWIKEFPLAGEVKTFAENDSMVWIGGDFGLLQVQKASLEHKMLNTASDRFPEMSVCAVAYEPLLDQKGLWVSSGSGLFWYDIERKTTQHFNDFDGIQGASYSAGSLCKRSDGSLWWGGIGGLNYFTPAQVKSIGIKAKPYLQSIQINGRPFKGNKPELHLRHFENNLRFHIGIVEFADADPCKMYYRLADSDWSPALLKDTLGQLAFHPIETLLPGFQEGKPGLIELEKLAPGNYVLLVFAMNSDGALNSADYIKIPISIQPPFWQTIPFLALVLLLMGGLFYLAYRMRLRSIQQEEQKKRAIERQKADLEIKATRAQMNTHFIKNILASIDGYILDADMLRASSYLVKCSQLMDKVLAYSVHPFITLEEELELLDQYIDLGAMGWREQLHYEVIFDKKTILPEQIAIPTMLLQPFVENALLHGLKNHPGEKRLSITFTAMKPKGVVCEIKNNGLKDPPPTAEATDRPHAIQIARERLRLYDLKYNTRSAIELHFLNGGVSVKISLGHPL